MKERITIGIIIDTGELPSWIFRVIENISLAGFTELKLVVHLQIKRNTLKNSKYAFAYRLHKTIDRFITCNRVDYSKTAGEKKIFEGIPRISLNSAMAPGDSHMHDLSSQIGQYNLDIILNFSSFAIDGWDSNLARYGVWQYRIENKPHTLSDLVCYWESVGKTPVIEAVIHSTNGSFEKEGIIHRSWIPTNFNSIQINLDHFYGLCSIVIPRLIKGFYLYGPEYLNYLGAKSEVAAEESVDRIYRHPSNVRAIINMLIVLFRYLIFKLEYHNRWKWFLMYQMNQISFPEATSEFKSLVPPRDRFWADPFVVRTDSSIFIFIEEFSYSVNKGHITLLKLDKDGELLQTQKILEKPYHLSYPFVFHYDNHYYMIPETSENRTIELYKCEEFPVRWSFVMNLAQNINAKDATIFFYEHKWWLFTAVNESHNFKEYVELYLHYSDDLFSKNWVSHPCNPIVTDIRNTRPAGRIFVHDNKIFRPAQDCSGRYGRGLNLNQIIQLTEESYKEVLILKTEATWLPGLKGIHTFNFDKDFSVIDVYRV